MRCWNCNHELPPGAKFCSFCEAPAEPAPAPEELDAASAALAQLPPEVMSDLRQAILESSTADEFVNRIFVGDCPQCGSSDTGNCESDPEINELLVGRCYDCGQLFCTECGRLLKPEAASCECWDEEDEGYKIKDER